MAKRKVVMEYAVGDDGPAELVGVRRQRSGELREGEHDNMRAAWAGVELPSAQLKEWDVVAYNHQAEAAMLMWLARVVPISARVAMHEIAYVLGVSTVTVRRYLDKYSAPSGPLALRAGVLHLKGGRNDRA